jgi:orotate phosphoribosyltransferase
MHIGAGMSETNLTAFLELVSGRSGHFQLESGHHSALWLDLDPLFSSARRIDPFVTDLVTAISTHNVDAICGPLVGGAFLAQLVAQRMGLEFAFTERVIASSGSGLYSASYKLPPAFRNRLAGKRVAIVDDVMSAGSALRGTYQALQSYDAVPIVAGALLVLGATGAEFFAERDVPVVAVTRDKYDLWLPLSCPLCAEGVHLEYVAAPAT